MERENIDFIYVFSKVSDLSGLPVRIYTGRKLDALFSIAPLVADPIKKYEADLLKRKEHVSYFITEHNDYYGVMKTGKKTIIIGPSRSVPYTSQELNDLAFDLNVPGREREAFARSMRSIIPIPLGTILQMMLSINYYVNEEKLNLSDLGYESIADINYFTFESEIDSADLYKNYNIEQQLLEFVRTGDIFSLNDWAKAAPSIRPSLRGPNQLRQEKNSFISAAALVSRTAVEAGMDAADAIKLCDSFIERCENLHDFSEIGKLQYELVRTFTLEVSGLKKYTDNSRLMREAYQYIISHISEPIRVEDIAAALYMSRSHLSISFKKQTGITVNDYIHRIKTERAKELLRDHTKSIALISDYLGYSSSSHFNRMFKKITSVSPLAYRKNT